MSLEDIEGLHKTILDSNVQAKHNVFMWTIDKYLHETENMMRELGYKLHARMIWDKTNGIAPAFTVRFLHEYLLWFYRPGNILMPIESMRGKYTTVIREASTKHSKKPIADRKHVPETTKNRVVCAEYARGMGCFRKRIKGGNQMKSRYLFRAKRKDNGELIEGCLAQYPSGRCRIFQTSSNGEGAAIKGMFEVDPETVEPVAAKLEKDKGHYPILRELRPEIGLGGKQMKLSDLKTGMRVRMRDGGLYLVMRDVESMFGTDGVFFADMIYDGFTIGNDYDDDMLVKTV